MTKVLTLVDTVIVTVNIAGVCVMFVTGVGVSEASSVATGDLERIGFIEGHAGAVGASWPSLKHMFSHRLNNLLHISPVQSASQWSVIHSFSSFFKALLT